MKSERLGWMIFFLSLALSMVGIIFIYSASYFYCIKFLHKPPYYLALKQAVSVAIGVVLALLIYKYFDYRKLAERKYMWGSYLLAALLLLFVLIFGKAVHGSKSWVFIGGLSMQPAEIAKVAIIVFVAAYIERKWYEIENSFLFFSLFMASTFLLILLILAERDLGSSMVVFIVIFAMLFVTGLRLSYIFLPAIFGFLMFTLAVISAPYRLARIRMLFDPLKYFDPNLPQTRSSYQLVQALAAFQRGSILGVGIGQGQQKLFFLPFPFSDFIYAHIGEEAGLVGAFLILLAFLLFLYLGLSLADRTDERLAKYLCLGLTLYIFLQAVVNMGVNIGMVPLTGVTLPFISQGGTSVISFFISVGIIMNVARLMPPKSRVFIKSSGEII